jgi:hypothetical protein
MPGGDRTGPAGMGPRTGRGAGFCAGYGVPGFFSAVGRAFGAGRGAGGWGAGPGGGGWFGRGGGFGGGRGWRRWSYGGWGPGLTGPGADPWAGPSRDDEKAFLEGQVRAMETELGQIRKRLEALGAPEARKADAP